jgi:ABC-type glutathione transport system ATPase component
MSNPSTNLAIEASGLVRSFGATRALDGIDLRVPAGAVYGLLGPNGAGKTTAVRVLATLLRPDGGEARVFGHDVVREADAVRGKVSLTGQFASVTVLRARSASSPSRRLRPASPAAARSSPSSASRSWSRAAARPSSPVAVARSIASSSSVRRRR